MSELPATASSLAEGAKPSNTRGRVIVASLIGTTIEFYDFYVYGTAAVLVFPKLFFPGNDPTYALLASFAVFGVAFVARPVGSVLFGHFGDRIGRKGTLVASLLTMGLATFLIGCLPTASTPGWAIAGPLLLVVMRFCQGLGLGGEWSGAALLATENAPEGKRAIWGTFPQLGAPIGFILANSVFILIDNVLSDDAFMTWGWRIPFLASGILVIVGMWVRLKLVETPAFQNVLAQQAVVKVPVAAAFTRSWRQIAQGTLIMLATYVLFYLMTAFTLTYGTMSATPSSGPAGLGYARDTFLIMLICGVVFFAVLTPIAGLLAERHGRRRMLLATTAAILVFGLVFVPLFGGGTIGVMALLIIGFALMGLTYGPMAAVLPELFPANVRYTGSAVAYNLAGVIGAAPAPYLALWLLQAADGSTVLVGIYLSLAAVVTFATLWFAPETRDVTYNEAVR
jgi:metabolite-proton symporter